MKTVEHLPGDATDPDVALSTPVTPDSDDAPADQPGTALTAVPAAGHPDLYGAARYDTEAGGLIVPTPIPGLVLTFTRDQEALTPEQMHMLAPIGIEPDWDPAQVAVFLLTCQAQGLDPWRKQAYLLMIDKKYVRHTSIGGLLSKAEDTGLYRGTVGPQWCGPDGVWRDVWLDGKNPPAAARVGILRADFDTPVWGVATYDEYAPIIDEWIDDPSGARNGNRARRVKTGRRRPTKNWGPACEGGKPGVMLEKCAKARGLRDTFPDQCGGFYVPEETEVNRAAERAAAQEARTAAGPTAAEVAGERRRAAFDQAMTTASSAGAFPMFAGLGISDDQARVLLVAELDEQAAIMGRTRGQLVHRWSTSRGGMTIESAGLSDLLSLVRAWREYVLRKLRADGRTVEADRYQGAPDVGTVDVLFGRPATTITVDATVDVTATDAQ